MHLKEARICQTKYAINLAKNHDSRLDKFISKCPWLIKELHLISAEKYYNRWKAFAQNDLQFKLLSQYHRDVHACHHVNLKATYYLGFDSGQRFFHSPEKDIIDFNNTQKVFKKLLTNLSYPSYILDARKEMGLND